MLGNHGLLSCSLCDERSPAFGNPPTQVTRGWQGRQSLVNLSTRDSFANFKLIRVLGGDASPLVRGVGEELSHAAVENAERACQVSLVRYVSSYESIQLGTKPCLRSERIVAGESDQESSRDWSSPRRHRDLLGH